MTQITPKEIVNYWSDYQKFAPTLIADWLKKEKDYLRIHIFPGTNILDVGCGVGEHLELITLRAHIAIGIDHQPEMVKLAKERLSRYQNTYVYEQDATNLKFPDNSFEYVLCMGNTFGNFGDKKIKALQEMKRVLTQNGLVIMSVYSENALKDRLAGYGAINLPIATRRGTTVYTSDGIISEQFTRKQLEDFCSQAGLKAKISELNPISYIVEAKK